MEHDEPGEDVLTPIEECTVLFAAQHGHATDRQVRAAGISLKCQHALIAQNLWKRVHKGVLGLAGVPRTWEGDLMAALLAVPGAAACGRSAARVHVMHCYRRFSRIKIAVPR